MEWTSKLFTQMYNKLPSTIFLWAPSGSNFNDSKYIIIINIRFLYYYVFTTIKWC